ncbi:uncharacterized protein LOC116805320 isoform X2 [Drosophila grimshawi]|uniref:uncharacterized protein LOC116805320 isoform X2 n=1 Tax=Drosophila grimshawi TaxID=7222 RepID=UPI001C93613B|nr:uncharacterized protein LOC116805320 isoform X2 [Drosophila grimshawi]
MAVTVAMAVDEDGTESELCLWRASATRQLGSHLMTVSLLLLLLLLLLQRPAMVRAILCCVLPESPACKRHSHTNLFIPGFQFLVCRTFSQYLLRNKAKRKAHNSDTCMRLQR